MFPVLLAAEDGRLEEDEVYRPRARPGYDAFARMERLTGGGRADVYVYTADDERLWTVDFTDLSAWKERFYLRDLDGKVLRVYGTDTGFDGTWFWDQDYVYRNGLLLATVKQDPSEPVGTEGAWHFILDHLGTPRMITDPEGDAQVHTYFPFGEELVPGEAP
jgi:uncharacterized protein RhaS with RHS repeats